MKFYFRPLVRFLHSGQGIPKTAPWNWYNTHLSNLPPLFFFNFLYSFAGSDCFICSGVLIPIEYSFSAVVGPIFRSDCKRLMASDFSLWLLIFSTSYLLTFSDVNLLLFLNRLLVRKNYHIPTSFNLPNSTINRRANVLTLSIVCWLLSTSGAGRGGWNALCVAFLKLDELAEHYRAGLWDF